MGSTPRRALVFCGTGNNGGDGLVVARHLYNARWEVRVILVGDAQRMTADAATNHDIVSRMGVPVEVVRSTEDLSNIGRQALGRQDIVIDALLGTGFSGIVREPMASVIAAINGATVKLIAAIDVPSGLDCDTGEIGNVATRADITITFVAPKPGFTHRQGPAHSGRVEVVDIGAPSALIDQVLAQDTT